jgi:hypothetical protein
MQRPEVRLVQDQQITINENPVNISSAEAYDLLAKYGYNTTPPPQQQPIDPNQNLTFQQMLDIEERKIKEQQYRQQQELNRPHAYTFNDRNVNYHNTDLRSLDDTGFGVKVQVVSDMNIDKGYDPSLYRIR